jgi:ribosomal protein L37AE/L43A
MRLAYYSGIAMRCKTHKSGLSPELHAVMSASVGLEPCRKFRKATVERFATNVWGEKCPQCTAFLRQWARELETVQFLQGEQELTS